ncbi:MAG: hypothetical protein ISR77_20660 [Pirellulaceae bacterium]|nr:hypothetical protein [Pirellulaceae bacterium]
MAPPDKILIPYEDSEGARFDCVGRYGDGNQFMAFVTGAFPGRDCFPPANADWQSVKSWNAVIHRFDSDGNHIGSEAKRGGCDIEGRDIAGEKAWQQLETMLCKLGLHDPKFCDIYVRPFSIEIDDVVYALEYEHEINKEDDFEYECVMLWPNDIMFHPPWDSGAYST